MFVTTHPKMFRRAKVKRPPFRIWVLTPSVQGALHAKIDVVSTGLVKDVTGMVDGRAVIVTSQGQGDVGGSVHRSSHNDSKW